MTRLRFSAWTEPLLVGVVSAAPSRCTEVLGPPQLDSLWPCEAFGAGREEEVPLGSPVLESGCLAADVHVQADDRTVHDEPARSERTSCRESGGVPV